MLLSFLSGCRIQCGFLAARILPLKSSTHWVSADHLQCLKQVRRQGFFLFPLCLLFLLIFDGHWIPQLHNCIFLIHSTFCLFHHQTRSLCILDLGQRLKTAAQPQGPSVCSMQRPGQSEPICMMHTAEMAAFQCEQQTVDANLPRVWRYPENQPAPGALDPHASRCSRCVSI